MTRPIRAARLVIGVILTSAAAAAASAADDPVLAGYQKYYRGDREGARKDLERLVAANPAALPARFALLQVLEEDIGSDPAGQADFERRLDAFVEDATARNDRSATDDEALFYLTSAHMLRAAYRFSHGKGMWGAARDGARSKRLGDAYIARHPEHGDAYFALGTYNYYVEIVPTFARVVRTFLFLPSGNRAEGLRQLERAYSQGSLFAFQAGMMLMQIYGSFENRPSDGVAIGERFAREYPDNPDVRLQLAELYVGPAVEDYAGAASLYERVLAAEAKRDTPRPLPVVRAQLGLASALQQQWKIEDAIKVVSAAIDAKPEKPVWAMPILLLRRANYRALLDDPGAEQDTRTVLNDPRWKDRHKAADGQLKWMTGRRASGEAAVYAALIRGNRLAAEHRWNEAAQAYESVRRDHPEDPQARYRLASMQFARGDDAGAALAASGLAADRRAPGWIRASSLLIVARAHDLAGRRAEAKRTYQKIVDDYERENAAWPARVGLLTPYRRH